jgi:long-chain acyl-CoA synthetase
VPLQHVWTAPVIPETVEFMKRFDVAVTTGFGSTEIGGAIARVDVDGTDLACCGRQAVDPRGYEVRVVDEHDREVPTGESGEVVTRGQHVMSGYWNRPEASAETLRGGWLHTGDLGRFDEAGNLTLVDRAKDVVITGGYNVYPREVEDVLLADPAVGDVAVIGVPDPEWGERVVAYLVASPGAAVDQAALDQRCLDAIARHKRPKEYRVVEELPRNTAGKVLKKELREIYAAGEEVANGAG